MERSRIIRPKTAFSPINQNEEWKQIRYFLKTDDHGLPLDLNLPIIDNQNIKVNSFFLWNSGESHLLGILEICQCSINITLRLLCFCIREIQYIKITLSLQGYNKHLLSCFCRKRFHSNWNCLIEGSSLSSWKFHE